MTACKPTFFSFKIIQIYASLSKVTIFLTFLTFLQDLQFSSLLQNQIKWNLNVACLWMLYLSLWNDKDDIRKVTNIAVSF